METPSHEIPLSESVRLVVVQGILCAKHAKMADPLPLDLKQLERWVLKQLRETVA
jgi:hypothetical protein